ncbi:MBL fold metallo-hydrolase [Streptomyces sp. NPDC048342]
MDTGPGALTFANEMGAADSGALLETLALLGRSPEDIDTVAFTHLHTDHTGWVFSADDEGTRRRTFPGRAKVLWAAPNRRPPSRSALTIAGSRSMARGVSISA